MRRALRDRLTLIKTLGLAVVAADQSSSGHLKLILAAPDGRTMRAVISTTRSASGDWRDIRNFHQQLQRFIRSQEGASR
jgi:hypothetical protein